ncbi:sensory histidine kinase UhpB [Streptomyces sp. S4.7]|uniref:sensor histidine kinase n=1 Tax=Streptomyces sp. S4.7 TaxID=2705439 RepID=UPI001397AE3A|nr:histidine kinase [Streptomyces sp. S4.7]QHY93678.1 sensory histidine kinase UhpB [Streptomyces sp. S4.7]
MELDEAHTARIALPLRHRLAAASPWSRSRIAGESVLTVVLAGLAGLLETAWDGVGVRTVAVVAGIAVLSLARRALPATVLVVSACAAAVLPAAVPLLIYASWSAGSRIMKPGRTVAAYAGALVLNTALSTYDEISAGSGLSMPVTGVLSTAVFFMLAIVPGLVARYRAQRRSLLEAQRRNNVQLMREQTMVAQQARLLERGRIAQDMHDSLGHQLVLISVHAGALQVDPDLTDRQREAVQILRDASVAAMRELREAVGILHEDRDDRDRPDERTEHAAKGTGPSGGTAGAAGGKRPLSRAVASIDGLVASSRAAGTTVEVRRSGAVRPLAPAADHAAFRIAQEGLTNAHKHAPGAPITLALRYESDSLVVEVANGPAPSGPPGAPSAISGRQGLTGLKERARLVGGMVHTGRTPDGGFRIAGMLPYGAGDGGPARPDDATSVAPDDDFAGQPAGGAAGNSGADINLSNTQGEFASIMSSRKNLAIGCAVTAVVLVLGTVALGVWGVSALMDELKKATISPGVYESAKVGDPEADVQGELPDEDSFLTSDLEDKGPRAPEGATCRHFASDDPDDTSTIFRFCFADGELVAKQTFKDKG